MGDFLKKAKDLISGHKEQVGDGIGKAGDFIDEKTGGKYADKVDMAQEKAEGYVDGLDDK